MADGFVSVAGAPLYVGDHPLPVLNEAQSHAFRSHVPWAASSTMHSTQLPSGGAVNDLLEPAELARKHFSYGR